MTKHMLPSTEDIDAQIRKLGWSRLFGLIEEHWPKTKYRVFLENRGRTRVLVLWQRNGTTHEVKANTWGECLTRMSQNHASF